MKLEEKYKYIVVGCGLSGVVIAERIANILKENVLIIEKRNHIGGNCYDYIDDNGILINKYGAHFFHTDYQDVWNYVNRFCSWKRWDHKVIGFIDNKFVPIPVNINTINSLCSQNLKNEKDCQLWLDQNQIKCSNIKNSRDMALSRVGNELYHKIFRNYTYKQWNKYPEELDKSVLSRIPVRNNFDDRYFNGKYQALPENGYTKFFEKILDNPKIKVMLNTDYLDICQDLDISNKIIIFTGPIDHYYGNIGYEKLEYRSLKFKIEKYKDIGFYQPNSVVNYPNKEYPFTRIIEYKHLLNQKSNNTTIVKEYSTDIGEPYYPVPNDRNIKLYKKYQKLAEKDSNIHFIGRLANYKYINMDQAIKNSLDYFKENLFK